jgi:hypothetical protein
LEISCKVLENGWDVRDFVFCPDFEVWTCSLFDSSCSISTGNGQIFLEEWCSLLWLLVFASDSVGCWVLSVGCSGHCLLLVAKNPTLPEKTLAGLAVTTEYLVALLLWF